LWLEKWIKRHKIDDVLLIQIKDLIVSFNKEHGIEKTYNLVQEQQLFDQLGL
jgi:hypothetical protein